MRLGHDLEAHASTREALAAGEICVERARVVVRWVDRLPADLGPETLAKAEAHLLAEARHHDAKALGRLGRRLWEVIAPGEADAHEAEILQRQEAAALRACSLTMADDGDGTTRGRFTLPTYHAAALKKMLMALAAPKHLAATQGPGIERRPGPEALGRALCELIERYPVDRLPATGGVNATVVVVIDEDTLTRRLEKAGVLDTGDRISPGMARRLACEAGIIPAVLGSASIPLDLGRRSRYHTEHQRIAMFLRDRGCRAEGCDRTTGLHAHHQQHWVDGGHTNPTASPCAPGTTPSSTTPPTRPSTSPPARSDSTDERDGSVTDRLHQAPAPVTGAWPSASGRPSRSPRRRTSAQRARRRPSRA
ncbi:DUF222 domain-containing protein [Nocardioides sp. LMS-CY]|uniref:DUF222 domain-containing protein n=1 Tax=Nocardioides sp. (strain LMS-CY) TaxID=2840457 RepID=UPI002079BAE7|nr:DUF222 domain-containing protein [Nocardioides sp. LMS-CY]